jgi:hypothetical protein
MITECFGAGQWDLSGTETLFVKGVFVLVKLLIPVAVSVYTWNVCQTGRTHFRTSVLKLEETNSHHQEVSSISLNKGGGLRVARPHGTDRIQVR